MVTGKFFSSFPRAAGRWLWCGGMWLHHDVSSFAARVMARWVRSPERIRHLTHVSTLSGITPNQVEDHHVGGASVVIIIDTLLTQSLQDD